MVLRIRAEEGRGDVDVETPGSGRRGCWRTSFWLSGGWSCRDDVEVPGIMLSASKSRAGEALAMMLPLRLRAAAVEDAANAFWVWSFHTFFWLRVLHVSVAFDLIVRCAWEYGFASVLHQSPLVRVRHVWGAHQERFCFWGRGNPWRLRFTTVVPSSLSIDFFSIWGKLYVLVVCSSCWENDPIGGNTVASYDVADKNLEIIKNKQGSSMIS